MPASIFTAEQMICWEEDYDYQKSYVLPSYYIRVGTKNQENHADLIKIALKTSVMLSDFFLLTRAQRRSVQSNPGGPSNKYYC